MATETERKFLVISDAWRQAAQKNADGSSGVSYHQGYLSDDPKRTVRIRTAGDKAFITIKGAKTADGLSCDEFEYAIPSSDAQAMLDRLCLPGRVDKLRHKVLHEGNLWEIDEFKGDNDGLIVAELELNDPQQSFSKPVWLGAEVTTDTRYANAMLAKKPFKNWPKV